VKGRHIEAKRGIEKKKSERKTYRGKKRDREEEE
jgi:hypothetical protein